MRLKRKISAVACGLLLSQGLFGQDVFENRSPIHLIDPDAYSDVQIRYHRNNFENSNLTNGSYEDYFARGKTQARLRLGSRYFEDRLNISATVAANLNDNSTHVVDRGTRADARFDLWSDEIFSVSPYMNLSLPHKDYYSGKDYETRIKMGMNGGADYEVSTAAGVFDFVASLDGSAFFYTKGQEIDVVDEKGKSLDSLDQGVSEKNPTFGLKEVDGKEGKKKVVTTEKSPRLRGDMLLGAAYKPSFVSGFTVGLNYLRRYNLSPIHQVNSNNVAEVKTTSLGTPDYKIAPENYADIALSYELSDRMTLRNSTFIGEAQASSDKLLLENTTTVSMYLF